MIVSVYILQCYSRATVTKAQIPLWLHSYAWGLWQLTYTHCPGLKWPSIFNQKWQQMCLPRTAESFWSLSLPLQTPEKKWSALTSCIFQPQLDRSCQPAYTGSSLMQVQVESFWQFLLHNHERKEQLKFFCVPDIMPRSCSNWNKPGLLIRQEAPVQSMNISQARPWTQHSQVHCSADLQQSEMHTHGAWTFNLRLESILNTEKF